MDKKLMTRNEAIEEIIKNHGGYATLKEICDEALNSEDFDWKNTNDYKANIRSLLQRDIKRFFKIKQGLWALVESMDALPDDILKLYYEKEDDPKEKKTTLHSYFQGVIIEFGNSMGYITYIPLEDEKCNYIHEKKLKDIAQMCEIPKFTEEKVVNDVKTIDVIWFNELKLPAAVFEIEHSGDFNGSLAKFKQLMDFNIPMYIISNKERKKNFAKIIDGVEFRDIKEKVKFLPYENIEEICDSCINIK